MKAAGILFISKNGNALFLRRTATAPDFPNHWDLPGGGQEGDESAEQTAKREAKEEVGKLPDGTLVFHTRTISGSAPVKGVAGPGAPPVGVPVDGGAPAAESPPLVPVPEVDFTTFLQHIDEEFAPKLNDEHDGWAWAPVAAPPEPLHPGCRIALDRLTMDELGVARAIADGRLASPQRYENVMLWAIRLTGTGASYRPKVGEFVFRPADVHLNPDALARWNGTPVIFQHPEKGLLTSEEFGKRVVGTVFLPYVSGDEAWGIAKIWDDDANRLMTEEDLSTSPGVNFKDFKVNRVLRLEDGAKVLKEGKPSNVDHVAICGLGVWDKGGEPSGIRAEAREDSAMADEGKPSDVTDKEKADAARKDASVGEHPDDKLSHVLDAVKAMTDAVGGLTKRMDAFEEKEKDRDDAARKDAKARDDKARDDKARDDKARKDAEDKEKETEAERLAADKAKKDAAEKEEKEAKEREDAARKDSAADVSRRIAAVEKLVADVGSKVTPISDDDHNQLAEAWSRCDDVCSALGQKTPRAMPGETSMQYRRRMVKQLRQYSPTWKGMKDEEFARAVTDDATFAVIEGQVMNDSATFARSPATAPAGTLRMIERRRDGHIIREFVGQPRDWMDSLAGAAQLRGAGRFAGLDGKIPS